VSRSAEVPTCLSTDDANFKTLSGNGAAMNEDERKIRELITSWNELTKTGDVDRVLELMSDDVVFTVVGRPPFGKQEFAEASRQMRGMKLDAESEVLEVTVRGETAWSRVRLRVAMTQPEGKVVRREGYVMSIYAKQPAGRWQLVRDANLLGPPQPA
jgi:uncharacterized protein (TIGR02246 family)